MDLLLASRNPGKLREFQQLLPGLALVPWPPEAPEIPEEGAFFQDNALQKATFARDWWLAHGTVPVDGVLADDSGLCVDALWGGPGRPTSTRTTNCNDSWRRPSVTSPSNRSVG